MRFESRKRCLVSQLCVLLVLAPLVVGTQQVDALSSDPLDAQLGRGLYFATAAAVSETMYLFGGDYYAGEKVFVSDQVVSIDARTGEPRSLTSLPRPLEAPSAITVGDAIYVIGGLDGDAVGSILRFDARRATVEYTPATLPVPLGMSCVASDGQDIYIFGGWNPTTGETSDAIQKFTPSTGQIAILPTRLPSPRAGCASTFAEGAFWILGGDVRTGATPTSEYLDEILRYDPQNGVIAAMTERLPSPRGHMAVAWNGSVLILAGGAGASGPLSAVLAFHPSNRSLVQVANLGTPRSAASAAVVDATVLVAGGYGDETTKGLKDIVAIGRPVNTTRDSGSEASGSSVPSRGGIAALPWGYILGVFGLLFGSGLVLKALKVFSAIRKRPLVQASLSSEGPDGWPLRVCLSIRPTHPPLRIYNLQAEIKPTRRTTNASAMHVFLKKGDAPEDIRIKEYIEYVRELPLPHPDEPHRVKLSLAAEGVSLQRSYTASKMGLRPRNPLRYYAERVRHWLIFRERRKRADQ